MSDPALPAEAMALRAALEKIAATSKGYPNASREGEIARAALASAPVPTRSYEPHPMMAYTDAELDNLKALAEGGVSGPDDVLRLVRELQQARANGSRRDDVKRVKLERRIRGGAEVREMARAEGYVLCRYKGAMPFVLPERDWNALPLAEPAREKPPAPPPTGA
jgi:hypothetical protein